MIKLALIVGAIAMAVAFVMGCTGDYAPSAAVAPPVVVKTSALPVCDAACKRAVDTEEAQDAAEAQYQRQMQQYQDELTSNKITIEREAAEAQDAAREAAAAADNQ